MKPYVEAKKVRGLWRLVEPGTNRLARTKVNHVPVDGGGSRAKAPRVRQAGYINQAKP